MLSYSRWLPFLLSSGCMLCIFFLDGVSFPTFLWLAGGSVFFMFVGLVVAAREPRTEVIYPPVRQQYSEDEESYQPPDLWAQSPENPANPLYSIHHPQEHSRHWNSD